MAKSPVHVPVATGHCAGAGKAVVFQGRIRAVSGVCKGSEGQEGVDLMGEKG